MKFLNVWHCITTEQVQMAVETEGLSSHGVEYSTFEYEYWWLTSSASTNTGG